MNIKNKLTRTIFLLSLTIITLSGYGQQLAFPGADGYGKYVTGGRGGEVYEVTNLQDDGLPGSLRYAVNQSGSRTIVFRVSGTIALNSTLTISNGNLTIAGQTAPGDGICIRDYKFDIRASNVIVRYIRFRLGEKWGEDAFGGFSPKNSAGSGSLPIKNIMIDHCSVSYGCDETLSIYDIENLTVQWCIISESLNKEGHGFGGIMGGWGASLHHTMFAHHKSRSPRFCGARYQFNLDRELVDMRYNVIYNAGHSYGGEGGHQNLINNYYKRGESDFCNPSQPNPSETDKEFVGCIYDSIKSLWYVEGNYVYGNPAQTGNNWNGGVNLSYPKLNLRIYSPLPSAYIGKDETAEEAFVNVCNGAGATLPKRDPVDKRVVNDALNNTGKVPLTLADIPGETFPVLNSLPAPSDTDHDGMSDDWETTNGLNINDNSDRNTIDENGYTMLEKYLNSIEFSKIVDGIEFRATKDSLISVKWNDFYFTEEGFIVERAIQGENFQVIDTLPANTNFLIDSTSIATKEYTYRIRAFNKTLETPLSSGIAYVPTYNKLTVTIEGKGKVSPSEGLFLKGVNNEISLVAEPEAGWKFDKWSGNLVGSDNPVKLVMSSDKTITATFIEDKTNINEKLNSGISLYPNPVTGNLVIKINDDFSKDAVIQLLDCTGKLIITQKVKGSETILTMETLLPGIYLVKVTNQNNESIIKQIVKK